MAIHTLRREQFVPRPLEEVFAFFADAGNLEKITPGWLNFQIRTPRPIAIRPGVLLDYRLKWHGLPIGWKTEIVAWNPPLPPLAPRAHLPGRARRHMHDGRGHL